MSHPLSGQEGGSVQEKGVCGRIQCAEHCAPVVADEQQGPRAAAWGGMGGDEAAVCSALPRPHALGAADPAAPSATRGCMAFMISRPRSIFIGRSDGQQSSRRATCPSTCSPFHAARANPTVPSLLRRPSAVLCVPTADLQPRLATFPAAIVESLAVTVPTGCRINGEGGFAAQVRI